MHESNDSIRTRLRAEQITLWQLADQINVSEMTINRWFRHSLTDAQYEKVQTAIREIITDRAINKGV